MSEDYVGEKVASLAGIDAGVARWVGEYYGGMFTRYGENFFSIVLSPYSDTESDLFRMKESCAGKLLLPSAVLQRQGMEFHTHQAPQSPRSLYTAYSLDPSSPIRPPIRGPQDLPPNWENLPGPYRRKHNFRPLKIKYECRIYLVSYAMASLFHERYAIWYEAQRPFNYQVGDPEVDSVASGTVIPPYPDGETEVPSKKEIEESGTYSKISLKLAVYAVVFDVASTPNLVRRVDITIFDNNGNELEKLSTHEG